MTLMSEVLLTNGHARLCRMRVATLKDASDRAIAILKCDPDVEAIGVFDPKHGMSTVAYWTQSDLATFTKGNQ